MTEQRMVWIDYAKGTGILLVILGHCKIGGGYGTELIAGFHMPLFFLISGYCFKEENLRLKNREFINKKLKVLIKPYFIMAFINLLLWVPVEYFIEKKFQPLHYIFGIVYSRGSREWMPNCSPLWFLTCLFIALLLFRTIERIQAKELVKAVLVTLCMLGSYCLYILKIPKLPWNIDTALMGVGFIYTGYNIRRIKLWQSMENWNRTTVAITGILLMSVGFTSVYLNGICVNFDSSIYGNLGYMLCGALTLGILILYLSYKVGEKDGKYNRLIIFMGRNTLPILGFNYFMNGVFKVFWQLVPWLEGHFSYWPLQFIFVTAGLVSIILLKKILEGGIRKWQLNY